jgi:hypothetical protein
VTNSTFSHNSASGSPSIGGGISNSETGTLVLTNSTFSNNSASGTQYGLGGGIAFEGINKGSSTILRFCTLYGNVSRAGGGIWVYPTGSGAMTISSNIIAANGAHDGPNISGSLTSAGYNLSNNFAGATGLNATTDRQVTLSDLKIDSTLRNNGGPTQTLALLPGSPDIDAVPGQACSITVTDVSGHTMPITTDERGVPRLHRLKNACDSGAYQSPSQG